MKGREKSGIFSVGLCVAAILLAVLLGNAAAGQDYFNSIYGKAPQTSQEREGLFKAFQNLGEKNISQVTLGVYDPYKALKNPYAFTDPQASLELANAYRQIQRSNSIYQNPTNGDNWYYWSNMWLNGEQEAAGTTQAIRGYGNSPGAASTYSAMDNPYAFTDPQASLELANAYRQIQRSNSIYQNPTNGDNWYYWSNMWLNGEQEAAGPAQAIRGYGNSPGAASTYSAMDNPYAFTDPQASLELANAYKQIQRSNSIYQNPTSGDNWYYWSNMWLNGP